MKFTPLILSLIVLPMIILNTGILSQVSSAHALSSDPNENPSLATAASVVEATNGLDRPTQAQVDYSHPYGSPTALPATAAPLKGSAAVDSTLDAFVTLLKNGQAGQVVGVYVPDVLALRVAQQPANNLTYVNANPGYATQFNLAEQYGVTGFLAHNYLSGALFFTLSAGQEVDVIYGDSSIRRYSISSLRHFQAISPTSPTSDFVDIDNSGARISNSDLFYQIYAGNRVVFQTCINAYGNTSWGRLFVIATPVS
jgi:hypothetical protein